MISLAQIVFLIYSLAVAVTGGELDCLCGLVVIPSSGSGPVLHHDHCPLPPNNQSCIDEGCLHRCSTSTGYCYKMVKKEKDHIKKVYSCMEPLFPKFWMCSVYPSETSMYTCCRTGDFCTEHDM